MKEVRFLPMILGTILLVGFTTFFTLLSQDLPLGTDRTLLSLSGLLTGLGFFIFGMGLSVPKEHTQVAPKKSEVKHG